jgi:S1-C subfamily serine protease
VTKKIAAALEIEAGLGLLVDQVSAGGLAERAGLRAGDVILRLDGAPIRAAGELAFLIEERGSDRPALTVRRGAEALVLALNLVQPQNVLAKLSAAPGPAVIARYTFAGLGVRLDRARVTGLNPGSPAEFAGLAEGDRILAVNGTGAAEVDFAAMEITGPVVLLVARATGGTLHVIVDPWGKGRGPRPVGGANVLDPAVVLF